MGRRARQGGGGGGRRGRRVVRARQGGWKGTGGEKETQRERGFQERIGNSLTVMHIWCACVFPCVGVGVYVCLYNV